MRVVVDFAKERVAFNVAEGRLVSARPEMPAPLADPMEAVRASLEAPFHFPPLRKALTPGDHVTVVVDEHLPQVGRLLTPVVEHIVKAGVVAEQVTLLCPPSTSRQLWLEDLPDELGDVRLEVHDPADRKRLAYVATTRKGKRLYLNRTIVEADQTVVLTGRRYDPVLGIGGGEGLIFPAFADAETRSEMNARWQMDAPDSAESPVRQQAVETAWLLGAPFFVQIIEGPGDSAAHVISGVREASEEAERLLNASWRRQSSPAQLVIASVSGDPARQVFADLAAAAASAARLVEPDGRIVLLSRATSGPGVGREVLENADEAEQALVALQGQKAIEMLPVLQWAAAARRARIYLLSGLGDDTVEGLFATPLRNTSEVQRLLDGAPTCVFLDDAHKVLAVCEKDALTPAVILP